MKRRILSTLCALTCAYASGACESQEQLIREADAHADVWGYPSPHIAYDVVYAEYGQRRLKLDLYRPPTADRPGALPGIIVVRGGEWLLGDKTFFGYVAGNLAMEGFVAASIEYRTSNEATFPAAIQDVKAAVRWLRGHAASFGVNPDAIGAIGGSAGAHLVAMLATSGGVAEFEGAGGNSAASSDVQAVVAMGGVYDLQWKVGEGAKFARAVTGFIGEPPEAHAEVIVAASPVTYVSALSAPLLLMHDRTDPDVPFGQSVELERRYRSVGVPIVLKGIEAPGVHAFWSGPRCFRETMRLAVEFFRQYLNVAK
jgi:pectinesterase